MTYETPAPGTITMFTTPWCGYCKNLKRQLDREGIPYSEVDIEQDPKAASYVESVNDGNQTVPTVIFPDGTAATNPSLGDVTKHLQTGRDQGSPANLRSAATTTKHDADLSKKLDEDAQAKDGGAEPRGSFGGR
ncbi:MAG TPA: mycoredoxin [Actinomycetales bacterium]|nr:mycoredoxin [Actinomycetales bacterium]